MVAALSALNLFKQPLKGIDSVGRRFGSPSTQKVGGVDGTTSPYQSIANTNCELTPNVDGGGYTNGVGAFTSTKNWMF